MDYVNFRNPDPEWWAHTSAHWRSVTEIVSCLSRSEDSLITSLSQKALHPFDTRRTGSWLPVPLELVHILAKHVSSPQGGDQVVKLSRLVIITANKVRWMLIFSDLIHFSSLFLPWMSIVQRMAVGQTWQPTGVAFLTLQGSHSHLKMKIWIRKSKCTVHSQITIYSSISTKLILTVWDQTNFNLRYSSSIQSKINWSLNWQLNGPINVNDSAAHLLVLFGNFLLFLLLLLDTFIVLAGLLKGSDEIIESSKKLIALGRGWVLREQATHSVELKQKVSK